MLNYGTGRMIGGQIPGPAVSDPRINNLQNSMMQRGAPVMGGGQHRYADAPAMAQPMPVGTIPFNPHIGEFPPQQQGGFSSMLGRMQMPPPQTMSAVPASPVAAPPVLAQPMAGMGRLGRSF